ncbi:recombination regulator RecX [Pseudomonas alcaligenes]|uniref:Regulatory protein RecX n=1 Tax=Aquipseudomonas alcaligenes TaxID=43263 RepID=A0ABR7S478_AQUAC|nr:recombination regulator RecX [Pseudomonas alcaligenes]MBC9251869.1 recombination regulator RecX [Pseudomonas alcaligenes]
MSLMLDTPVAVRRAAMDLLARREHGRTELSRKLRQRGASDELIDSALDRLAEEGLLSEGRYLESFIASRGRSGYGPLRIREELGQRGLPRAAIEQALGEAAIDWSEQLRELWQRKFAGQLPQDMKEKAKQARFLAYRGFSQEQIGRLLRGALD